jgi:hypothetical protein
MPPFNLVYILSTKHYIHLGSLAHQGPFPEEVVNKEQREKLRSSSLPVIKREAVFEI